MVRFGSGLGWGPSREGGPATRESGSRIIKWPLFGWRRIAPLGLLLCELQNCCWTGWKIKPIGVYEGRPGPGAG